MDNIPDMIYFKDRDSRFVMVNKAAAAWHGGRAPEEIVGTSDFDAYSHDDAQRMRDEELQIMETGTPVYGKEEAERWKDGSEAWVSTTKVPLRDENGDVIGIFGLSRDITDHKKAELRAARLAAETRQILEEMEHDLLMASQLQKSFFPTAYPVFPVDGHSVESKVQFSHLYHARSGVIGGDLCSIRKLSDTKAGIFLCDVMGNGVRAALGTCMVRAIVEEYSQQEKDPGRFMQRMNRALWPLFRIDGQFLRATACYMVLDVSTGSLRMAIAGHPSPILLDAGSECATELMEADVCDSPELAVHEDAVYETVVRHVGAGSTVLAYTEGISRAVDSNHVEYGVQRLKAAALAHVGLPLSGFLPAIYDEVCAFSTQNVVGDDACLVGFQLAM